jgi:site-specific recombinase XerD
MNNFHSFLAPRLNEYLTYRKNLGYSEKSHRLHLLVFDRYLKHADADWDCLQPAFFLEMRANLNMQSESVNKVLSAAHSFFLFLVRYEYLEENPLRDIPMLKENTIVPFVFSSEQTDQLLEAVCKRVRRKERLFLTDLATYTAILLLARCGMRISEPLRLRRHHYRSDDRTIYIEKTKFRKDRLIPIPHDAIIEIENYLSVRKHLGSGDQNPYLLAGREQKPLNEYQVRSRFHQAVEDIGLKQPRKIIGNMIFNPPVPHSLRHSFAINTLIKIKARGENPQYALPILAAFLGHSVYKHTTVYLRVADALSRKRLLDFSLWQRKKT